MRLNKKFTINNYINMICCWRSTAILNHSTSINTNCVDEINEINEINPEYLDFDIKNYQPTFLGEGHYGNCYKIIMDDKDYTCKKIKITKNSSFNREVKILKTLTNKEYLPEYFISFTNLNSHYILYNFIPGKDLFQSLKEGFFELKNKKKVLNVVYQCSNALFELFNHNLVHLDIKLENIVLTNKNPIRIKIIDLESCKKINNRQNTYCGTAGYASPEMILQHKYYYNTDVWSLGVVLFMLYTHSNFLDKSLTKNKTEYLDFIENYNNTYIKTRLLLYNCFDQEIFDILCLMLHKLHVYRISIHGLKKHFLLISNQD